MTEGHGDNLTAGKRTSACFKVVSVIPMFWQISYSIQTMRQRSTGWLHASIADVPVVTGDGCWTYRHPFDSDRTMCR